MEQSALAEHLLPTRLPWVGLPWRHMAIRAFTSILALFIMLRHSPNLARGKKQKPPCGCAIPLSDCTLHFLGRPVPAME